MSYLWGQAEFDNIPDKLLTFIDRDNELELLSDYLFTRKLRHLSVWGEAGVGKTSFAKEFVYRVKSRHDYDSVVWTTAKQIELDVAGGTFQNPYAIPRSRKGQRKREGTLVESLTDVYRLLLKYSHYPDYEHILGYEEEELLKYVLTWMTARQILLVVDDLDSWEDWRYLLRFVEKIPFPSAVLITSRRKLTSDNVVGIAPLHLGPLSIHDASTLLNKALNEQSVQINANDKEEILRFADGNPLIISLSVALIKRKIKSNWLGVRPNTKQVISDILKKFQNKGVMDFLFEDLYQGLSEKARRVLISIAVLNANLANPSYAMIARVSGMEGEQLEKCLDELRSSSLIDRETDSRYQFDLHKLIFDYAITIEPEKTVDLMEKAEVLDII